MLLQKARNIRRGIAEIADVSVVLLKRALFSKLANLEILAIYSPIIMLLGFPSSPEIGAIYLIYFPRVRVGTK